MPKELLIKDDKSTNGLTAHKCEKGLAFKNPPIPRIMKVYREDYAYLHP